MPQKSFDKAEFIAKTQELLTNKHFNKALMDSLPLPCYAYSQGQKNNYGE